MELRKQKELEMYEEIYSARQNFVDPNIREGILAESENYFIQKLKEICPGKRVLEIGCGEGKHSILAAQFGAKEVLGVDVSEAAISLARQNGASLSNVRFEVMDIENLNLKDGSFDVVIDHESLSSVSFHATFQELYRVLRPGGKVLGIECLGDNPIFNLNRFIKRLSGKRTKWANANIMTLEKLDGCGFRSDSVEVFHLILILFSSIGRFLGYEVLNNKISKLDSRLSQVDLLRPYFFKCVFELSRI